MGRSLLSRARGRHLSLRPARPGDGAAAHAVFHAAVHRGTGAAYSAEERAAWAPSALPEAGWEARLLAGRAFVAEIRGGMVGFMTLHSDGHVDLAYVAPEHMGQGVGTALLGEVVALARAEGMALLTTDASLISRPFFARHGWHETARQSVIRHGVALTNFRMELAL